MLFKDAEDEVDDPSDASDRGRPGRGRDRSSLMTSVVVVVSEVERCLVENVRE